MSLFVSCVSGSNVGVLGVSSKLMSVNVGMLALVSSIKPGVSSKDMSKSDGSGKASIIGMASLFASLVFDVVCPGRWNKIAFSRARKNALCSSRGSSDGSSGFF